jgi:hypothetical protein
MDCRIKKVNKMKNITKLKYSVALVLFTISLQAQETFPDDVQDVPIDNWIFPIVIVGALFMFYFIKKKTQVTK